MRKKTTEEFKKQIPKLLIYVNKYQNDLGYICI